MPGLHAPCGQRGNSRRRCWCSGLISKQHNLEEGSYFFAFFSRVGAKVVGFFFSLVFWFFVCAFWGCFCAFSWVFLRRFRAGRVFFFARVSADFPSSSSSKPHHTETGGPRSAPFFFLGKKCAKPMPLQGAIQYNAKILHQKTQTQLALPEHQRKNP